jgi:hypothetical protein
MSPIKSIYSSLTKILTLGVSPFFFPVVALIGYMTPQTVRPTILFHPHSHNGMVPSAHINSVAVSNQVGSQSLPNPADFNIFTVV